jgi:hemoglobin-like flavoprotein
MTPEQIEMVRASWQDVMPIRDKAAELFYGKLFEMDPSLQQLFTDDMTGQGKKLMEMLDTIVQKLDRLGELLPEVRDLALRHVQYGVKDGDYDTVGGALLWTLKTGLGKAFTPGVAEAWNTAYTTLSDAMRRDTHDPIRIDKLP